MIEEVWRLEVWRVEATAGVLVRAAVVGVWLAGQLARLGSRR